MKSYRGVFVLALALVCLAIGFQRPMLSSQQASAAAATAAVSPQRALVNKYCVTCHNDTAKTAGIVLDKADVDHVAADPALWEKVVYKLRAQAMPPVKMPRPDQATYDGFRIWLENELDKAGAAHPNPGTTVSYHRLNRTEYQNAIRDLLNVNIDTTSFLPEDATIFGFDNIGGAQIGLFSNRYMVLAVSLSIILLLMVVNVPFFQPIFKTSYLSLTEWTAVVSLALLPAIAEEITKAYLRSRDGNR